MLTQKEQDALDLTVLLVNLYAEIVGDKPSREGDMAEFVFHIHGIQHALMAQAAGRAYPEKFRLLGELVERKTRESNPAGPCDPSG